jgi:PAS domain S-box-containing protein
MERAVSPLHAIAEMEPMAAVPDDAVAPPGMTEERLRRLVEATRAVPWEASAETWQFTYVGRQAAELLGYPMERWYTKDFWVSALHTDDREGTIALCLQSAARLRDYELEYRMVAADGRAVWIHDIVNVVAEDGRPKILRGYMIDVTSRRNAEAAARRVEAEHLAFERLLADLSARFVNIPSEKVDAAIEQGLQKILEFFRLDRCGLVRGAPDKATFQITHACFAEGIPPVPLRVDLPTALFPWAYQELVIHHRVLSVATLDDMPAEASVDKQTYREWGIQSHLNIPIVVEGSEDYIIAINAVRGARAWPEEYIPRLRLLGEIFVNALERRRAEEQVGDLLRFERLLSHLSARCVNLPATEVDQEIGHGLQRVGEFLGVDRASLSEFSAESGTFRIIHWWGRQGISPPPLLAREDFPWVSERLVRGEVVCFARPGDLPDEARLDREGYRRRGVRSHILVPLAAGGSLVGAVSFCMMHAERSWAAALLQRLRLVGEIFASALERQRAEGVLRESEARFRQMADASPVMIWVSGPDKGCTYLNKGWLEFTGRTLEQELGDGWAEGVHPDDLQRCLDTYVQAFDDRKDFSMEYRLRRRDGEYRWIWDMGVPRLAAGGRFEGYIGSCTDVTERRRMEAQLQGRLAEIEDLKRRLEEENVYLRAEMGLQQGHGDIVGQSDAMKKVLALAEQVARTDSTVLILGETGTGKELLARAIHNWSPRRDRPLVTVNCASLPATLIESELFGREKGAYTGALTRMAGRFEVADGSTIFLDEVGDLPLEVQAKLLRVLQEGQLERLGSAKTLQVNVRVIAATNRDLAREVKDGRFRMDLYYRLNVFPITIPPLRERPEDIPLLVWKFVGEFDKKMGKRIENIAKRTMDAFQRYSWPGNARELRNGIERAMIVSNGKTLDVPIPAMMPSEPLAPPNLEDLERRHILSVLERAAWRLTGRGGAAEILGLKRTTLQSRMKKLGIKRPTA